VINEKRGKIPLALDFFNNMIIMKEKEEISMFLTDLLIG